MTRLALAAMVIALSACSVGEFPGPGGSGGGVDAGGGGGDGGSNALCETAKTPRGDGRHNEGQGCLNAGGCHGATPGSTVFTVAGTLYTTGAGAAPSAGSTIILVDGAGLEVKVVTSTNGNFYTSQAVTFPVTAKASLCPTTKAMTATAADGNCNSCHSPAGQAGARINIAP